MSKIAVPASMTEFARNPSYGAIFALAEEISKRPGHHVRFGWYTCEDTGAVTPWFLASHSMESNDVNSIGNARHHSADLGATPQENACLIETSEIGN